jgi:hypothetical protein
LGFSEERVNGEINNNKVTIFFQYFIFDTASGLFSIAIKQEFFYPIILLLYSNEARKLASIC